MVVKGHMTPMTLHNHTLAHVPLWGLLLACWIAMQNVNITRIHVLACRLVGVGWGGAGVWHADKPDKMLAVSCTGGCSSTRKAISPQTQQSALSSPKWKEWATPMWMEMRVSGTWPTTSSHRRLVTGCLKPFFFYSCKNIYCVLITWLLISQDFVLH